MVKLLGPELFARAAGIRLLVSDVDGVLTDAGVYFGAKGEKLKRFSMRDGMGVELLRQAGIRTAWLTREESPIVAARAKKLQIDAIWSGERDKRQALPRLVQELGADPRAVAYIGDDVNDVAALAWVAEAGLAACPNDAVSEVEAVVQFVTRARGGHGAFREVCDLILSSRKEHT